MSEINELYNMKLHDKKISPEINILRVPGGWIYTIYDCEDKISSVFVPFDNGFMEAHNK